MHERLTVVLEATQLIVMRAVQLAAGGVQLLLQQLQDTMTQ